MPYSRSLECLLILDGGDVGVLLFFVLLRNFTIKKSSSKRTRQWVLKRFPSITVKVDYKKRGSFKGISLVLSSIWPLELIVLERLGFCSSWLWQRSVRGQQPESVLYLCASPWKHTQALVTVLSTRPWPASQETMWLLTNDDREIWVSK